MVKYVCDFCDEKFNKKEDAIEHEKTGECVRNELDLIYRCVNQSLAEGKWDDLKKYIEETNQLLKLFEQFTGDKYVPSIKVQNIPFGKPIPYQSSFGNKKTITPDNLNNVMYVNRYWIRR